MTTVAVWLALWLLCAVEAATVLACLVAPAHHHPWHTAKRLALAAHRHCRRRPRS